MSSMRNAVTRRPHRERAQPQSRSKWGLLEKHKDYSLRAADYNKKKEKLAILTTKVRDRHPDEFAYGMINKKQGQHGKGGTENRLGHDAVRLLRTQDAGYLRTVAAKGRKEMRKVKEELGSASAKEGRKIVFVDESPAGSPRGKKRSSTGDVLEQVEINEVVYPQLPDLDSDEPIEDMALDENAPKAKPKTKKQLEQEQAAAASLRAARKKRRKLQEVRSNKLEMLQKRQKEILAAADQLELQRAKMAKTVGGVNKNGVKFKVRERKR
ncbi:putative U3 small nucleolar RNA-associated protein 11 [Cyphellophora attinorum]|uniref:U3 small nucleolar RNA-associated protein 11 n=1 Tax=Cyphellophora attinorum TaxID=1664694 RepID=A0A0N1NY29_9EURO|nr:putative U3 small nucleolar RNA-associated protein 11 [Phialophora attinorum]KPI39136.1 putative U3 small nucleolar RNA-associated protein 11 [Phialophora attinorum]